MRTPLGSLLTDSDYHLNLLDSLSLSPHLSQCTSQNKCILRHLWPCFKAVCSHSLKVHEVISVWIMSVVGALISVCARPIRGGQARVWGQITPTRLSLPRLTGSVGMWHLISYLEEDLWGQGGWSSSRGAGLSLIHTDMKSDFTPQLWLLMLSSFHLGEVLSLQVKVKLLNRCRNFDYVSIKILEKEGTAAQVLRPASSSAAVVETASRSSWTSTWTKRSEGV